jgi:hypothetical protein
LAPFVGNICYNVFIESSGDAGNDDKDKDWAECYKAKLVYVFAKAVAVAWAKSDCHSSEAATYTLAHVEADLYDYFYCPGEK